MVQRASIELKRVVSLCLLWESFVVYFISQRCGQPKQAAAFMAMHFVFTEEKVQRRSEIGPRWQGVTEVYRVVSAALCSVVSLLRSLVRSVLQCEADEHGVLEALGLIVKTL